MHTLFFHLSGIPGISVWKINGSDATTLLIPPKMNDKEVLTTLRYEEGDNVNLECVAEGIPTPKYSWRRDDKQAISIGIWSHSDIEGSSLNMSRVRREQMGTYVCFANNGVPPQASKKYNIEIAFKPSVTTPKHVVGAHNGSFALIECILESFPTALTYWMFGDERIIENSWKYKVMQEDVNQYTSKMTLNITYVENTDYGMYKCVAKNQLGYVKGIVNLYRIDMNDPNSFQEPTTKVYGEPTLPPPEVTCPPCSFQCPVHHCKGPNSYNTVTLSDWTWTGIGKNQSQWTAFKSRTRKCLSSDTGVLELFQVGKPVYYTESDVIYGCWMQDPNPKSDEDFNKYWMTKSTNNKILYEYANKDDFRQNSAKELKLQYPMSGNAQVVYNSSFYYNYEAMNRIVKYDLKTKEYKYMTVPFAARKPDKTILYETQFNYMDIAADENGLWVIYAANNTNNTIVLKFDAETLQYEKFWNISFDHRLMGEMFIICGVLYGVDNVTDTKTKIRFAFDLYTKTILEDVAVDFTNPFRNNTFISYYPKYQRIYALDAKNVIEYPIRFKESTNEEND
ncbi:uncharacterized protein B4U80_08408 [Leptotrombidium deliense]|uniref:Uncharacterized protein n=1 Tax=Leptotrombidium deliense TaxID=299467 RepID=A0A443SNI0_9ACAR|nr:uncharacterized protein B4U80_08408 [Leptotrombidium deliense]